MSRIDWDSVVDRAVVIVGSYDTSMTLRQLFYRLVSEQLIPNSTSAYKRLSSLSAERRRSGAFPDLIDRGRAIHRYESWDSAEHALSDALAYYRLDRTDGQDVSLYLGVEKAGMVVQLQSWFGDLGVPMLALGGYSSQTYVADVVEDVKRQTLGDRLNFDNVGAWWRPAVLLYAGDFDPSGEDIDRDFLERTDCWHKVTRVALTLDQVREHRLPINPGKTGDSRAAGFIERHGQLMQVELDALDPDTLRTMFAAAIAEHWDTSAYEAVLTRERADRERLADVSEGLS